MRKRFLAAALCGIIFGTSFTACGKNANTAVSGTADRELLEVVSDITDTYIDTDSETVKKSTEIISKNAKTSEILPEISETKTEIFANYTEIANIIICSDDENVFTAEEYLASILDSGVLTEDLGAERDMLQLADIDGNGISYLTADC